MKLRQIRVDGYKNLINCVVDLGDFNVLVGPNNSGKSNFLEAIQSLFLFSFASEKTREAAFKGLPASVRWFGTSIPHMKRHQDMSLNIGITFEMKIEPDLWTIDYDFSARRKHSQNGEPTFMKESLMAKPSSRTGVSTIYIDRDTERLFIRTKTGKKERRIAGDISALTAIKTLYPEFDGLPSEMEIFIYAIETIALIDVFQISPDKLRESIGMKSPSQGFRISSFDFLAVIDEIHKDAAKYELFRQSVCDVLDIEDLKFVAKDIPKPSTDAFPKSAPERVMYCYLKRRGDTYAHIGEYSDGTLVVVAVLSAVLSGKNTGPILCIEELENCLHPAAVERLLRFLQDNAKEWPVLITTHSPYVLNCVNPEDVNVAVVDETGATYFKKVRNTKQLRDYLRSGFMSFGDMLVSNFEDVLGNK